MTGPDTPTIRQPVASWRALLAALAVHGALAVAVLLTLPWQAPTVAPSVVLSVGVAVATAPPVPGAPATMRDGRTFETTASMRRPRAEPIPEPVPTVELVGREPEPAEAAATRETAASSPIPETVATIPEPAIASEVADTLAAALRLKPEPPVAPAVPETAMVEPVVAQSLVVDPAPAPASPAHGAPVPAEATTMAEGIEDASTAAVAGDDADEPAPDAGYVQRLLGWLDRHKTYPARARRAGEEGVAVVEFSLDPAGHVIARRLVQSSGFEDLDQEALALIDRASPLPAPDQPATFVAPLEFVLR